RSADAVAEMEIADVKRADELARVGVEQQLMRIEAVALQRGVRSMHAIAIEHSRIGAGQIAVPDAFGIFGQGNTLELTPPVLVEKAKLNALGIRREQREIRAARIDVWAKGIGAPLLDPRRHPRLIRW